LLMMTCEESERLCV